MKTLANQSQDEGSLEEKIAYLIVLVTWTQLSEGEKSDLKDNLGLLALKLEK